MSEEQYETLDTSLKSQKGVLKWIVDKFMKPMRYSKKLIGRSIEKNSVILFFLSILVLAFYYLFVGLLFLYFKSMIYEVIGMTPGVDFIEAFALLFGSGIQAFLLWIKKLKEKSKSEENKDMNIWQSYGVLFSLALWAYSLFIFWVFSPESFFYTQSGGISIFSKAISLFMGFFMIYVLVCLLRYGVSGFIKFMGVFIFFPMYAYIVVFYTIGFLLV